MNELEDHMNHPPIDIYGEERKEVKLACGCCAVCALGWEREEQEVGRRAKGGPVELG